MSIKESHYSNDLDLTETLIDQYKQNNNASTREEIISLLLFQKTQLELRSKKLKKVVIQFMCINGIILLFDAGLAGFYFYDYKGIDS